MLVYLYYKHRKNGTTDPAALFEELPRVTVQLPIFNEQYVVERLLESICKLQYPKKKLDIQVLDDSTDETVEVARGLVERYAALGNPISYHHRANREGYKAGALSLPMSASITALVLVMVSPIPSAIKNGRNKSARGQVRGNNSRCETR